MNSQLQRYDESKHNDPTEREPVTVRHPVSREVAMALADAAALRGNLDASRAWLEMADSHEH
jgi:hypothetical protein